MVSGRREKFVPRGGPDGGDGGDGGGVYIYADPQLNTLLEFRYKRRFVGDHGGNGMGGLRHGRDGGDVEVPVPVGTQVWTWDEPGTLLGDLAGAHEGMWAARGGQGGRGNARYASPTNRFPLLAEAGEQGEELRLRLELKLLADVGIVGEPNVGKSSLLAAVSAARPRIGAYPFTTLEPELGVVEHRGRSFVMVDIPGLIEGAHQGVGLGHDFLRHIERTRVVVHMVDGSGDDPRAQYERVVEELRLFRADLLDRPRVLAVNKIDLLESQQQVDEVRAALSGIALQTLFVSAATGDGLDPLLDAVSGLLDQVRHEDGSPTGEVSPQHLPVLKPKPVRERPRVVVRDGTYVVLMDAASRVGDMVDQTNWEARMQFFAFLKRLGVIKALDSAGVSRGDVVTIGKARWEWE